MKKTLREQMRIRNYSERTVSSYIASIAQLSKYYKIPPDKISREQVKSFAYHLIHSRQVSTSTINQCMENTPKNIKHRMILTLAYATGLRRAELLNLTLKHTDPPRNIIRVIKGKGNKSREVPAPAVLIQQLREYYKYYRPKTYLFEGYKPGMPYSATSIEKIGKGAAVKAGIKKVIVPSHKQHI